MSSHADEVRVGHRFEFGKNWKRFLSDFSEEKITFAVSSLKEMLSIETLKGKTFLDAGSGSGLFSLAAVNLGASVHSFDFDPVSVECTKKIKELYCPEEKSWVIETGSVLNQAYMNGLKKFDIVYSWGVLHHTGNMMQSFINIKDRVTPGGKLYLSIYNDQGCISTYWLLIKKLFNRFKFIRPLLIALHAPYLIGLRYLFRFITGRYPLERGMIVWYDMLDWLGGYPFEVAKPELVVEYFNNQGFKLVDLRTCGNRMGCNEFIFDFGKN